MRLALIAAVAVTAFSALSAPSAQAQTRYSGDPFRYSEGVGPYDPYGRGYRHGRRHDFQGQADRPGDYRCDAYWDANRTDCGAAWRDQRSVRARSGWDRRWSYDYGHAPSATVYPGVYGRPDLGYPGGRRSYGYESRHHSRDPRRIDDCRAAYRSYDPDSGYYRTYDGRLVFCG